MIRINEACNIYKNSYKNNTKCNNVDKKSLPIHQKTIIPINKLENYVIIYYVVLIIYPVFMYRKSVCD